MSKKKQEYPSPAEVRRNLLGIESVADEIQRKFFKPGWQAKTKER